MRQPAIDEQKTFIERLTAKENNAQSPSGSAAMGVLLPISITFVKLACRLAECAYSARRRRDDLYYIGTFCGHFSILIVVLSKITTKTLDVLSNSQTFLFIVSSKNTIFYRQDIFHKMAPIS